MQATTTTTTINIKYWFNLLSSDAVQTFYSGASDNYSCALERVSNK